MRSILIFCLLAGSAMAQSTVASGPCPNCLAAPSKAAQRYLVEFTTTEKCYECNTRFLMVCAAENPECNVPSKVVAHYKEFAVRDEALKFINQGMEEKDSIVGLQKPNPRTFSRLLEFSVIELQPHVSKREEPQPAKVIETTCYSLGNQSCLMPDPPKPLASIGDSTGFTFSSWATGCLLLDGTRVECPKSAK